MDTTIQVTVTMATYFVEVFTSVQIIQVIVVVDIVVWVVEAVLIVVLVVILPIEGVIEPGAVVVGPCRPSRVLPRSVFLQVVVVGFFQVVCHRLAR